MSLSDAVLGRIFIQSTQLSGNMVIQFYVIPRHEGCSPVHNVVTHRQQIAVHSLNFNLDDTFHNKRSQ